MDSSVLVEDNPKDDKEITVIVRTLKAQNYPIKVSKEDNVEIVKNKFVDTIEGDKTDEYILISLGRVLNHKKTLASYDVQDGQVIQIAKKPKKNDDNNTDTPAQTSNNNSRSDIQFHFGSEDEDMNDDIIGNEIPQIFSNGYPGNFSISISNPFVNTNRESLPMSEMRRRMNHILDLLMYSRTAFFVLNNPSQVPPSSRRNHTNDTVTITEYFRVNREVHELLNNVRERFRLYEGRITDHQDTSNNRSQFSNDDFRLLMRIQHHLSHVLHHLSSFNVVIQNNRPVLSFQVLPQGPNVGQHSQQQLQSQQQPQQQQQQEQQQTNNNLSNNNPPSSPSRDSSNSSTNSRTNNPSPILTNSSFPPSIFGISLGRRDRNQALLSNIMSLSTSTWANLYNNQSENSSVASSYPYFFSTTSSSSIPSMTSSNTRPRTQAQAQNTTQREASTNSSNSRNENAPGPSSSPTSSTSSSMSSAPTMMNNYDQSMPCDSYYQFPECRDVNVEVTGSSFDIDIEDVLNNDSLSLEDVSLNWNVGRNLRSILDSFTEGVADQIRVDTLDDRTSSIIFSPLYGGGSGGEAAPANTDPASRVHLPNDQILDDSSFGGAFFQLLEQTGLLHRASDIVGPNISPESTQLLEQFPARVSQLFQEFVFHTQLIDNNDREALVSRFVRRDLGIFTRISTGLQPLPSVDLPLSLECFFNNSFLRLYREFGDPRRVVPVQSTVNFLREFLFSLVRFFRKVLIHSSEQSGRALNNANILPSQFWHLIKNFLRTLVNSSTTNSSLDNYLATASHQLVNNLQNAIDVIARMHLSLEINVNSLIVHRTLPTSQALRDQDYILNLPSGARDWRQLVPDHWICHIEQDIIEGLGEQNTQPSFTEAYEDGRLDKDKRDNKKK